VATIQSTPVSGAKNPPAAPPEFRWHAMMAISTKERVLARSLGRQVVEALILATLA
jgi:hypothetical protein